MSPTETPRVFLKVLQPANKSTVSTRRITIRGKTIPDAVISINQAILDADSRGRFSYGVTLKEGANDFSIVASAGPGNEKSSRLRVVYRP